MIDLQLGWTAPWIAIRRGGFRRYIAHLERGNIGFLGVQLLWSMLRPRKGGNKIGLSFYLWV